MSITTSRCRPWVELELESLKDKINFEGDEPLPWELASQFTDQLLPLRSGIECQVKWYELYSTRITKQKMKREEVEFSAQLYLKTFDIVQVVKAVYEQNEKAHVEDKENSFFEQGLFRFDFLSQDVLNLIGKIKGKWSSGEDRLLLQCIKSTPLPKSDLAPWMVKRWLKSVYVPGRDISQYETRLTTLIAKMAHVATRYILTGNEIEAIKVCLDDRYIKLSSISRALYLANLELLGSEHALYPEGVYYRSQFTFPKLIASLVLEDDFKKVVPHPQIVKVVRSHYSVTQKVTIKPTSSSEKERRAELACALAEKVKEVKPKAVKRSHESESSAPKRVAVGSSRSKRVSAPLSFKMIHGGAGRPQKAKRNLRVTIVGGAITSVVKLTDKPAPAKVIVAPKVGEVSDLFKNVSMPPSTGELESLFDWDTRGT